MTAANTDMNKLTAAVAPAIVRRIGSRRTSPSPSRTSRSSLGFSGRDGAGSVCRMFAMNRPDRPKLTAFAVIATGAVSSWTSTPATDGPAICATEALACNFVFPSTRSPGGSG